MWDVLTWHNGTLAIAWWAVIVLVVGLLSIGGTAAAPPEIRRLRAGRRAFTNFNPLWMLVRA
jgi:hypothetical protein